MATPKSLHVFLYDKIIGTITHLAGERYLFAWEDTYINDFNRPTLSLSFKNYLGELITDFKPTKQRLPPFFANLLPEGLLRDYLAGLLNINPEKEFALIQALGQDLPGAITIKPLFTSSTVTHDDVLTNKFTKESINTPTFHFSLAGVQLKFSAIECKHGALRITDHGTNGDWIIKLPDQRFSDVPENEYTMMTLAAKLGINVPEVSLIKLSEIAGLPKILKNLGEHAFVIKRFDRSPQGKIHIEDFAQVFNVYPEKKYQNANYRNIAQVLWSEGGKPAVVEFIKRLVFSVLIGNGDMHLKNFSLIYYDKTKPTLSPAYDFISTIPYINNEALALNFVDSKTFTSVDREQFKRFSTKAELPDMLILETVDEFVEKFHLEWKHIGETPLNKEFKLTIDQHLRHLRL